MATVKITNILTKVIADGNETFAVISPTGIPTPCTPVQEYISDMVTIIDGTLFIPAYNKFQKLSIPFGAYTQFTVTNPEEVNYWENIKVDGAKVEVTCSEGEGLALVEPVTYTLLTSDEAPSDWGKGAFATKSGETYSDVTFTGTGTAQDPYEPAYEADTYYAKTVNKLPTNDVTGD